jgi:hypothetical protein
VRIATAANPGDFVAFGWRKSRVASAPFSTITQALYSRLAQR